MVVTELSLQERSNCQAEAKIEVFCCMWFNGDVRMLPRVRSHSNTMSAWAVAYTAVCSLPLGKIGVGTRCARI